MIEFTDHTLVAITERGIRREWVERALYQPEFTRSDLHHPKRRAHFRRIEEFGGRWLRVVYENSGGKDLVITAFFDRKAEKQL